jgi:ribosomal protein L37AE/L43A
MALPTYKDIVELVKKGSTLEAQEKILEFTAALEIQEENLALRDRIKILEAQLEIKRALKYEKPYYWVVRGEDKDGPHCQLCYDKEKHLIRLQGGKNGTWHCGACKHTFYDSGYQPPEPPRRRVSNWRIT